METMETMETYGDLVTQYTPAKVEIVEAAERILVSPPMLSTPSFAVSWPESDLMSIGGEVAYRIVGWEPHQRALIAVMESDHRQTAQDSLTSKRRNLPASSK